MNKIFKSILSVSAAAVIASAALTPAFVQAWGDSNNGRNFYTIADINAGKLGKTITFNSITDGKINEKYFVGAKPTGSKAEWNPGEVNVKDGETYTVRLYVHNNSLTETAKGVRAHFSFPMGVAKSHTMIGYLESSNANPGTYWDEVTFKSDDYFYLEYVNGSAKYTNEIGTFQLKDEVVTNAGATLGYETMNGEIPGCFKYDGNVTIEVKVHKSVTAQLAKTVRLKGTKEWKESVEAKVGDEVEFRIFYKNLLAETAMDVMIRDILPDNIEYVKDSTYLYNSYYQKGTLLDSNDLTTKGVNIGGYKWKNVGEVWFTGKVVDKNLTCGKKSYQNQATSTVNGAVTWDDASVVVIKDDESCKGEPVEPTPEPEPKPTPEPTPESTPSEIVPTGPVAIASGAVGAGSIVTALGYYIASRKKLM